MRRESILGLLVTAATVMLLATAGTASVTLAPTIVVVSPVNMDGWAFQVTSADGKGELVAGPATPPLGVGSAHLFTGTNGSESAQVRNTEFDGTPLGYLTILNYSTYAESWNGQQLPYIILNIDNDTDSEIEDLLFFEPAYQTHISGNPSLPDQGAAVLNTWQEWDALHGGWWSLNGIAGATPGTGVKSLVDYLAVQPDARIVNSDGLGGVRLVVGFADEADIFNGYVDKFRIGLLQDYRNEETIYDFEPIVSVKIDIKPGSYPNSINLKSKGVLPIAILGSGSFDVKTINASTININGVGLATRGSKKAPKLAYSYEDVNGDGVLDMVVFFRVQALRTGGALGPSTTKLTLTGALYGGTPISGTDSVRIVPPLKT